MSREAIIRICREALDSPRTGDKCSKVCAHPVFYQEVIELAEGRFDSPEARKADLAALRRIFGSRRWIKMDSSEDMKTERSVLNP